ncbi:Hypothetical Protein FCC1311_061082 [Hondaea fermentalgiana]|uniref:Endonuclease/exonuclease/phosphatase domain-containing protein n=1 Tax=Hondaea fermentalgiana TaxID=2315210 RepID=A0A2R5GJH4_9STRA|nr:Hypothetical Protein FCC1311_061082 [Hondaea fermentalgiana]|eukprot:GBG29888.1 Hypothetical Protein FCC1311_061082 [Hondaea fermentalgiana]
MQVQRRRGGMATTGSDAEEEQSFLAGPASSSANGNSSNGSGPAGAGSNADVGGALGGHDGLSKDGMGGSSSTGTVAEGQRKKAYNAKLILGATALLFLLGLAFQSGSAPNMLASRLRASISKRELHVATWNIAAINNNPFEYWLTLDNNPDYDKLMEHVQDFIESPGANDVAVSEVFTESMFKELVTEMRKMPNFDEASIKTTMNMWKTNFRSRKIISGFLKDGELGKKRLTSMPDRVTNTIPLRSGESAYRPTVINCFGSSLDSMEEWWTKWRNFMFRDSIDTVKSGTLIPASMLKLISREKYPVITEQEAKVSIPLQTLCAAIFDAVLVHMMNVIDGRLGGGASYGSKSSAWQGLRSQICHSLNLKKNDRILDILSNTYLDREIIFLQEVAGAFIERARRDAVLSGAFHIVGPTKMSNSDQNSVILLSKERFPRGITEDITNRLKFDSSDGDGAGKKVAAGDVTIVHATDVFQNNLVLASFHGDTNGLQTVPVVRAVTKVVAKPELLLFGLDANTYEKGKAGVKQDVTEFASEYVHLGLDSCWGQHPNPRNFTTYNGRTYLQSQLNKASKKSEIRSKGDVNPKDFILFKQGTFAVQHVTKDNTGKKAYMELTVFPTLEFPSDHGVLSADLELI